MCSNYPLGALHKRCWNFLAPFDTPLAHVGIYLLIYCNIGISGPLSSPEIFRRLLWLVLKTFLFMYKLLKVVQVASVSVTSHQYYEKSKSHNNEEEKGVNWKLLWSLCARCTLCQTTDRNFIWEKFSLLLKNSMN